MSRPAQLVVGAAILFGALNAPAKPLPMKSPPAPPADRMASAELSFGDCSASGTGVRATSTNRGAVEALADLLRNAAPSSDHKCGDTGEILIRMTSGAVLKVGTLGGHEEGYHQLRVYAADSYRIFRVEREKLEAVMALFGIAGSALDGMAALDPDP